MWNPKVIEVWKNMFLFDWLIVEVQSVHFFWGWMCILGSEIRRSLIHLQLPSWVGDTNGKIRPVTSFAWSLVPSGLKHRVNIHFGFILLPPPTMEG